MNTRLLALLVVVGLFVAGCANELAWRELRSVEGQFSLSLPGSPEEKTEVIETEAGDIDLHLFLLEHQDIAYMVGYSDYPQAVVGNRDPEEILDGARDGVVSNAKGKLVSEQRVMFDGNRGREIKIETERGIIEARLFFASPRLYQLMVITAKQKNFSKNIEKFFESFMIDTESTGRGRHLFGFSYLGAA